MKQAIILAAGNSTRYGSNKLLTKFDDEILTVHLLRFCETNDVESIIIVINPTHIELSRTVSGITFTQHPIINEVNHFRETANFKPRIDFVMQDVSKYGPAAGLMAAKDLITDDYFILFGDNYLAGKVNFNKQQQAASSVIGYLNLKHDPANMRYAAITDNNRIIEKPHPITSGDFFIGFVFMKSWTIRNLRHLKKSCRGEYEISDFVNMAPLHEKFNMEELLWMDITTPADDEKITKVIEKNK